MLNLLVLPAKCKKKKKQKERKKERKKEMIHRTFAFDYFSQMITPC